MLIFGALNFDCVEFQLFTVDYAHIYGRMHSDSTPSLIYGLTSAVTAVTIESVGVTPPELNFSLSHVGIMLMSSGHSPHTQ